LIFSKTNNLSSLWLLYRYNTCYLNVYEPNIYLNYNRGPSLDASYQVSVIFPSGFREDFLEIDQPETRIAYMAAMSFNWSGRNEQSL
jgi:hypothetical protein